MAPFIIRLSGCLRLTQRSANHSPTNTQKIYNLNKARIEFWKIELLLLYKDLKKKKNSPYFTVSYGVNVVPEFNKSQLIQNFQLHQTVGYHKDSMKRVEHLESYSLRKASVLIGFVERGQELNVIFTRRAKHLRHHPGQISFPGGKYESEDIDLADTALRETFEEIGIERQEISIFGQMPELVTISRFSVTPFLAFVDDGYVTTIDTNEVDEVFEVPARVVFDQAQLHSQQFKFGDYTHRVFGLSYQNHFIWGMTAQIIQALQKHVLYR